MKRAFVLVPASLVGIALFGLLVHAVLVAMQLSEPAAVTVQGLTPRRFWATASAGLALIGAVIGGLALTRPTSRFNTTSGQLGSLAAGAIVIVSSGLNLATANGGPGTGNGVVGAAGALVLGVIAIVSGGLALARSRRNS